MDYLEMAEQIKKGGHFIFPRGYGKTRALAIILRDVPDAVVVSATNKQSQMLQDYCRDLGFESNGRIHFATPTVPPGLLFVDEYSLVPQDWKLNNSLQVYTSVSS
jgi:hypothetical protein